jgi:hypothetical protein
MFSADGKPDLDRQQLVEKADAIEARIRRLQAINRALRHAAVCPAPSHAECPTFQRYLRAAAAGALPQLTGSTAPKSRRKH